MKNNFNSIKKKFNGFSMKIETLKRLEKELNSLDTEGFESEAEAIKLRLKSPDKIPAIKSEIAELKEKINKKVKSVEPTLIEIIEETPKIKKGNSYAVIIGVGKYQDEGIPTLKYAKEDALEIYNVLTDPKYGNFPRENVKLLLDEQATLKNIKYAMGTFLMREAGIDDTVCIYFSGHGSPEIDPTGKADDNIEKFIVPYNAEKDDLFSSGLSMDVVRKILDERIKSKRAVLFIDSCYSGEAGGRTFSRSDTAARNITISDKFIEQLSSEGRIIITASKPDELSLEIDEFQHGIFTYYLAEGLRGKADPNNKGVVTVDGLYRYVHDKVEKKARMLGGVQHPVKKGTVIGEISLTHYETKEMILINELILKAERLFKENKYEEALTIWNEVLGTDNENTVALAGINKSNEKIKESKAILRDKQRKLLNLHKKGLPTKEYDEAMLLIKMNQKNYTELEQNIVEYIEKILDEDISIEVYIDTLNLIKENSN